MQRKKTSYFFCLLFVSIISNKLSGCRIAGSPAAILLEYKVTEFEFLNVFPQFPQFHEIGMRLENLNIIKQVITRRM